MTVGDEQTNKATNSTPVRSSRGAVNFCRAPYSIIAATTIINHSCPSAEVGLWETVLKGAENRVSEVELD